MPLTGLLRAFGWETTFAVTGCISVAYGALLLRPATRAPFRAAEERAANGPVAGRRVWTEVKSAWRLPSGRLGFWVHFTCMAGPTTFATLWGFPYLTQGLHYSTRTAASLMLLLVLGGVAANLAVGQIVGRRPGVRTPMAVLVCCLAILGWLVLILWPGGHPPFPVVVAVVVVFSISGPTSSVAFMLARDYNPRHRISTATGMVNIGGFCGAVIGIFLVGQILDLVEPVRSAHTAGAFRLAFVALVVLTGVGLSRMLTWWLRTRAMVLLAVARGEQMPVRVNVHRWELVDMAELAREAADAQAKRRAQEAADAQEDDAMATAQHTRPGGAR